MSATAADDNNANSNNINFTTKDTKFSVSVVLLWAKYNQELTKLLSKAFQRSVYWNEYKTKSDTKKIKNGYRYFLDSKFIGVNRFFFLSLYRSRCQF